VQDKTVLVTGASSGIGKSTARELARMGATVVLVCRDRAKADAAVAEIRGAFPQAKLELLIGDLSSMADVRRVAAEFRAAHARLDVLINNAGVILIERKLTPDGLEKTFATNHLASFLLTELLLEPLKAAAPSRVINVASAVHTSAKLDLGDVNREKHWAGYQQYCDTKLMNVLFTRELARKLEGTGVTVNAVHPGVVSSGFGVGEGTKWFKWGVMLAKPFMISPEKGSRTIVWLATSDEVAAKTGGYYAKQRIKEPSRQAQDPSLAKQLWDLSAKLTSRVDRSTS
jgi:NAD(P)-dependent dehydrogenase (short-subunit alcohol dehydrogenase family)